MDTPCARFRSERSAHGYGLKELKSALQKYIRRGNTAKALWSAGEIFGFRSAPEPDGRKRIQTNLLHRLQIILLEDVGAIDLWTEADRLCRIFGENREPAGDPAAAAALYELVALYAAAPKARVCSHARAVARLRTLKESDLEFARRFYPQIMEVYDRFRASPTSKPVYEGAWREGLAEALRARDPAAVFWAHMIQDEGVQRAAKGGRKAVWQVFEALESTAGARIAGLIPMARRWYKSLQNLKEAFLCWMLPLLAHVFEHPRVPPPARAPAPADPFPPGPPIALDPFVYDIHTGVRSRGGLVRFAKEGALVENESNVVVRAWKEYYEDRKRIADGIPPQGPDARAVAPPPPPLTDGDIDSLLEDLFGSGADAPVAPPADAPEAPPADAPVAPPGAPVAPPEEPRRESDYELISRIQLVTSHAKTDTVFARHPDGRMVVLKGPYMSPRCPNMAIEMAIWKRANGLPAAEIRAVRLIPDRWASTPLGARNSLWGCEGGWWFSESESLVPGPIPTKIHSSKLWPPTEVVDWSEGGGLGVHTWRPSTDWATYTHRERLDYVLNLLARYLMGIGDHADRNFLRARGRLYAVDEDMRNFGLPPLSLRNNLRKKKAALVRAFLEAHWEDVAAATAGWGPHPAGIRVRGDVLALYRSKERTLALFD